MIATFAGKTFKVTGTHYYTMDEFQYSSSLRTETQDTKKVKPATYTKGPDLDTMSFKTKIDAKWGYKPRKEWDEWKKILVSGTPYKFILGNKPLGSYHWQLTGVNLSDSEIDNKGNIISLVLELQFTEFRKSYTPKKKSSSKSKSSSSKSSKSKAKKKTSSKSQIKALSKSQIDSLING